MDRWVVFQWAGCVILPPSVEESIGPPEFLTLPCARATVFDPGGFAEAMAVGLSDGAFHVSQHVGTHSSSHNGAQSLHACALRPVHSLCTLRWRRYRHQRNTRYPVPGQGFRGQALPLTGNAELCSAHVKTRILYGGVTPMPSMSHTLLLTSASNGLMRRCLLRWQDERCSPTFRHR